MPAPIRAINPGLWYIKQITPLDVITEKDADILQAVLETGQVDLNRTDDEGNTLLHKVCAYNPY